MANSIDAIRSNVFSQFEAPARNAPRAQTPTQAEGPNPSAPRIQDSASSRRIKDGVNASGQMGPLSPAEHLIVEQVQESLDGERTGAATAAQPKESSRPPAPNRGALIDFLA